eukprot:3313835-Rhodomonas_salina.2
MTSSPLASHPRPLCTPHGADVLNIEAEVCVRRSWQDGGSSDHREERGERGERREARGDTGERRKGAGVSVPWAGSLSTRCTRGGEEKRRRGRVRREGAREGEA